MSLSSLKKVTPYSDFYKKRSRTPGATVDDEDDDEINDYRSVDKSKLPKSRLTAKIAVGKNDDEEETRKKAIRRRLKIASGKVDTGLRKR